MADKITQDEYFLKELGLTTYIKRVKKLGLEQSLQRTTVLSLKKISPSNIKSKHAVIAISGFLTEHDDKGESWRHIVNHYTKAEVYAIRWNSLSVDNIFNEGYLKGRKPKTFLQKAFGIVSIGKK